MYIIIKGVRGEISLSSSGVKVVYDAKIFGFSSVLEPDKIFFVC